MSSIKINIFANIVGKIWVVLLNIFLIPQYIKYLGIESFGLVGFFSTLISSMAILDLGLGTTLNRELARFKTRDALPKDIRNLTFSLECIYWTIGIFISILIASLSNPIATYWINAEYLPKAVVSESVILMGIVIAFLWPVSLYSNGLTGLEKQVTNNIISIVMNTIRAVGVFCVIKYFSPTIKAFFISQVCLCFLYVTVMRWGFWKEMPFPDIKPKFSKKQIKTIWRFAAGMTGITVVTFFLSQTDKIILSKILSLSQYGYYILAFSIASAISLIVNQVGITFFPRLATLIASKNEKEVKQLYHKASTLVATFVSPFCFTLIFFMYDILRIWTKNTETTTNTFLIAIILVIGSMLNSLMVIPYNLIIANGWTRFTIYQNSIAAIILVPMLFLWTNVYGAVGATFVWLIVNAGYIFISQPLMHRKLLKHELKTWYINDTLIPMLPSLFLIIGIKLSFFYFMNKYQLNLYIIGIIFILALYVSFLFMKDFKIYFKNLKNQLLWKQIN